MIGALAGRGDTVFSDELNHASIVDGCRLSRAEVVVYRHADVEHLLWSMRRHSGRGHAQGGRLIVTDSVFSMDGDVAPLAEIVELAQASGARLAVDEAHAIGTYGPGGRGALAELGLEGEVDAIVGTLGKALGSYGAYVCGDEEMVRYLLNTSRSFIFSTAAPPPAMAGALAALELLQERPHRVERLGANARTLRRALAAEGFAVADGDMHIVPLIVGDERDTLRLCQEAIERGVFAQAIRPADRAGRDLAAAPGGDGLAHGERPAHGRGGARRGGAQARPGPGELGTPLPEPEPAGQPEQELERESARSRRAAASSTPSAPFDIEQPRPRRPPAPAQADADDASAPFDGERESAVAHAA